MNEYEIWDFDGGENLECGLLAYGTVLYVVNNI
jgi:hypothetical protein